MTLHKMAAPAITRAGVERLFNFTAPARLKPDTTLFQAGYEQAKRDMRDRLIQEVGRPADDIQSIDAAADYQPAASNADVTWWKRWTR